MIKAIVFDMDGLMLDTESLYIKAMDIVGQEMGVGLAGYISVKTMGMTRAGALPFMQAEFGMDFDANFFWDRATDLVAQMIEHDGVATMPGLHELLEYTAKAKLPTAVASSSKRKTVLTRLEIAGVLKAFQVIVAGDEVSHSKPDPEIYQTACRRLGFTPQECMALEDSRNGIWSAHSAGCKTIMIPDLWQPDDETEAILYRKLDRLDQVIELLQGQSAI